MTDGSPSSIEKLIFDLVVIRMLPQSLDRPTIRIDDEDIRTNSYTLGMFLQIINLFCKSLGISNIISIHPGDVRTTGTPNSNI
jgi:hypothetical protein